MTGINDQIEEHIDMAEHVGHSSSQLPHVHPEETTKEYVKFGLVIVGIMLFGIGVTAMRGWGGNRFAYDFMAVFFMTFASFKFFNLELFVEIYRTYDLLSQKFRPWAYMFPFVEAGLGLAYFISSDAWMLNLLTMLITGTAGYSVYKALAAKSKLQCACLGSLIKLPLTKVSFVENGAMFVMAFAMLFL